MPIRLPALSGATMGYVPFDIAVYSVRFLYLEVRVTPSLAFTVFPLLPPSGSGLVVVTGRFLPRVVDAALRLLCEGETGTAHMKQCFFSVSSAFGKSIGANPINNPSLKNEKAT